MEKVRSRSEYTYPCQICGLENFHTYLSVPVTKQGNYGADGTPTSTLGTVSVYTATTISFISAVGDTPAKLSDDLYRFVDKYIRPGYSIVIVSESGLNDGYYTIADKGVKRGEISVEETTDSYLMVADEYVIIAGQYVIIAASGFTSESAEHAGEVTIYRSTNEPNVTTGCPFCGSLNSRR